ncbi:23S ribosomal RNA methyltransferase Erm [Promicromonospora iranensis]|uniref:23S rRNA (Adenine-N6)-dimethyltransferase n=1 Tax=Promicromonospora iranensis TaxID=1105144 RepID=A0ABU2CKJ7_9MICO|nr:23S ribosomal RNA methyltransferase Erm [Promicromonospora iranensis]MDR7381863.1 23S rRNA (adenine-N6)-dimethyltransferase [Promicromonospora iranensis]
MSRNHSSRTSARNAARHALSRAASPDRRVTTEAAHDLPGGAHELGQNLLVDTQVIRRVVDLVPDADRPLVEWAAGRGALTLPLARLGRPLEAVEIDPRSTGRLGRTVPGNVTVTRDDILRHAPPSDPYDLVCNVPFHLTTPVLRRLFTLTGWQRAVLITQWEVARKRAAVGGATLLTAQWWPWFSPRLDRRVPAGAFRPRPSVDAGVLVLDRRAEPLLPAHEQRRYQRFAAAVFNGRGRGLHEILARHGLPRDDVRRWARENDVRPGALPRELDAHAWVGAYRVSRR